MLIPLSASSFIRPLNGYCYCCCCFLSLLFLYPRFFLYSPFVSAFAFGFAFAFAFIYFYHSHNFTLHCYHITITTVQTLSWAFFSRIYNGKLNHFHLVIPFENVLFNFFFYSFSLYYFIAYWTLNDFNHIFFSLYFCLYTQRLVVWCCTHVDCTSFTYNCTIVFILLSFYLFCSIFSLCFFFFFWFFGVVYNAITSIFIKMILCEYFVCVCVLFSTYV